VPGSSLNRVKTCEVVRSDAAARASDHLPLLSVLEV
jgi:endonuclease/exonuclease/phosphatase family metal-dependent hydrolase